MEVNRTYELNLSAERAQKEFPRFAADWLTGDFTNGPCVAITGKALSESLTLAGTDLTRSTHLSYEDALIAHNVGWPLVQSGGNLRFSDAISAKSLTPIVEIMRATWDVLPMPATPLIEFATLLSGAMPLRGVTNGGFIHVPQHAIDMARKVLAPDE